MPQRTSILLLLLLLAIVVGSGIWVLGRLAREQAGPSVAAPTATLSAVVAAGPTPTPLHAPPGYRLAGVALGEPESFAVVEAPDGAHTLYRLNDEVPDLGRLIRIDAERAIIEGKHGKFEMWLAPAATATPTYTRKVVTATPRATPRPTPPVAGTTPESSPSIVPGRPVS